MTLTVKKYRQSYLGDSTLKSAADPLQMQHLSETGRNLCFYCMPTSTAGERRQHVSNFLQLGLALVSFPVLFKSWLIRGAQTPSSSLVECEITVTSYCFNNCHVWTRKNLDINVDTSMHYAVPRLRYVRTGLINCKHPALLKALFVNLVF